MSDLICKFCGEPYDVAYLRDEEPEWFEKMKRGKGCPTCKGVCISIDSEAKVQLAIDHLSSLYDSLDEDITEYI